MLTVAVLVRVWFCRSRQDEVSDVAEYTDFGGVAYHGFWNRGGLARDVAGRRCGSRHITISIARSAGAVSDGRYYYI